jgi:hypothetical protein
MLLSAQPASSNLTAHGDVARSAVPRHGLDQSMCPSHPPGWSRQFCKGMPRRWGHWKMEVLGPLQPFRTKVEGLLTRKSHVEPRVQVQGHDHVRGG